MNLETATYDELCAELDRAVRAISIPGNGTTVEQVDRLRTAVDERLAEELDQEEAEEEEMA